jgi:hypothetical protein
MATAAPPGRPAIYISTSIDDDRLRVACRSLLLADLTFPCTPGALPHRSRHAVPRRWVPRPARHGAAPLPPYTYTSDANKLEKRRSQCQILDQTPKKKKIEPYIRGLARSFPIRQHWPRALAHELESWRHHLDRWTRAVTILALDHYSYIIRFDLTEKSQSEHSCGTEGVVQRRQLKKIYP